MERPVDHEERMQFARRVAQWELGDAGWAGVIIAAYFYPSSVDLEEMES